MPHSSTQKYPAAMVLMHWLVAVLVLSTLVAGWLLDQVDGLIVLHRSLGLAVLLLAIVRLANTLARRKKIPPSLNQAGSLQLLAEKAAHGLLYLFMLAVPLTGWLKTNAAGHAARFFGLFDMPTLLAHNPALSHLLGPIHSFLAAAFAWLIGVHVLAALLHGYRHGKQIFKRMFI